LTPMPLETSVLAEREASRHIASRETHIFCRAVWEPVHLFRVSREGVAKLAEVLVGPNRTRSRSTRCRMRPISRSGRAAQVPCCV
jgi:hypothetical protein